MRWQYFCHYACCQLTESRSTAVASGGDHKMFYLKKVPLHWKRVGTAAVDCTDLLPSYGRKFFSFEQRQSKHFSKFWLCMY